MGLLSIPVKFPVNIFCREQQGKAKLEMLCPNSTYYTGLPVQTLGL